MCVDVASGKELLSWRGNLAEHGSAWTGKSATSPHVHIVCHMNIVGDMDIVAQ